MFNFELVMLTRLIIIAIIILPLFNSAMVIQKQDSHPLQAEHMDLFDFYEENETPLTTTSENNNSPMIIVSTIPLSLRTKKVRVKKALTVLSRWRPLMNSYIDTGNNHIRDSFTNIDTDGDYMIPAETRIRRPSRPKIQPLRWGRRKRSTNNSKLHLF